MLKKILRWLVLVFLIILALSGVAIGAVISPKKERDFDNEIKIELLDEDLEADPIQAVESQHKKS